jgi:hypothetical protein
VESTRCGGAGIYNSYGVLTITDSLVSDNAEEGIWNQGTYPISTVTNSTVSG